MAPQFNIVFDNPSATYFPGTNVTGKVVLHVSEPTSCKGLKIVFNGSARVSWTESESVKKNDGESEDETIAYSSQEEYFSTKYYLVGSENGEVTIPIGNNVYTFSTTLPQHLPTSLEGEYGYIRYTVNATLERSWKTDYHAKANFSVIAQKDLNFIDGVKAPVKNEVYKHFCCCCCKSGPLTLVAWLPYSGYVIGQDIPITVELDNASNVAVDLVNIKLKKQIIWTVRSPSTNSKTTTENLAKLTIGGVDDHSSNTVSQTLTVPQMPFINLDSCSIIDVSFILKVEAVVRGIYRDLELEIPLVLGTIPLEEARRTSLPQNQLGSGDISSSAEPFSPNASTVQVGFNPHIPDDTPPPYPPPPYNPSFVLEEPANPSAPSMDYSLAGFTGAPGYPVPPVSESKVSYGLAGY